MTIDSRKSVAALQSPRRAYMIVTASGSPQSVSATSEDSAWQRLYLTASVRHASLALWRARRREEGWKCIVIDWSEVS